MLILIKKPSAVHPRALAAQFTLCNDSTVGDLFNGKLLIVFTLALEN